MLLNKIRDALKDTNIFWQKHSLQRMLERNISRAEVKEALQNGMVIEEYLNDYPFPSILIAYLDGLYPLHEVASWDKGSDMCYIITAYMPDEKHFEPDLITRKNDE